MASAVISSIWAFATFTTSIASFSTLSGCRQRRMGLLHDKRHFQFAEGTPDWETLAALPLGFLTKGMHYRESIEMSFKSKGFTPKYVFESDSTFQIIQAVQAGICCAIMPLNNGLEALSDNLEIIPIRRNRSRVMLALIMRNQQRSRHWRRNVLPMRRSFLINMAGGWEAVPGAQWHIHLADYGLVR